MRMNRIFKNISKCFQYNKLSIKYQYLKMEEISRISIKNFYESKCLEYLTVFKKNVCFKIS